MRRERQGRGRGITTDILQHNIQPLCILRIKEQRSGQSSQSNEAPKLGEPEMPDPAPAIQAFKRVVSTGLPLSPVES